MIADFAARSLALAVVGFARLVTGVIANWRGCLPAARQRVYFANHTSHGDFVLIWTVLPRSIRQSTRPVAAVDYWGGNGLRGFIGREVFNAVLVDRLAKQPNQGALAVILAALGEGASLILFPEGTRNMTDQELLPFRSGLYRLAVARPEAEFVPVWIDNISRVIPKGELLPVPLLCSVTFGAPITVGGGEDKDAFLERSRQALLALRPMERRP